MKNLNSNTMLRSVSKTFGVSMILGMLVFSVSCKKVEKGDTGPAGAAGTNGNANVMSLTTTLNSWSTEYNVGGEYSFSAIAIWSSITADVRDRGMVMAYQKDTTGGTVSWTALPYAWTNTTQANNFYFVAYDGYLKFYTDGYTTSGPISASSNNGTVVRIVAIPASGMIKNPKLNLNNYVEVANTFNLKD